MICIEARVRNREAWEGLIGSLRDRLESQDRMIRWRERLGCLGEGEGLDQLRRERKQVAHLLADLEAKKEKQ